MANVTLDRSTRSSVNIGSDADATDASTSAASLAVSVDGNLSDVLGYIASPSVTGPSPSAAASRSTSFSTYVWSMRWYGIAACPMLDASIRMVLGFRATNLRM